MLSFSRKLYWNIQKCKKSGNTFIYQNYKPKNLTLNDFLLYYINCLSLFWELGIELIMFYFCEVLREHSFDNKKNIIPSLWIWITSKSLEQNDIWNRRFCMLQLNDRHNEDNTEILTILLSPVILDSSIAREWPVIRTPSAGT